MPFLVVGGVTIPVARDGVDRGRLDLVDRRRAFDGTYRASATGNAKREWRFSTPPVTRARAAIYEHVLKIVTAQAFTGDLLEGAENLALQSEDFGVTWGVDGTPIRSAYTTVGGITIEQIGDDSAALIEGYKQTIPFAAAGIKGISLHVAEITSTSSVIRLSDESIPLNRLLAVLTWSAGLPVVVISTGTYFGYELVGTTIAQVFRLKFGTGSNVDHTHTNVLGIYPATRFPFEVVDTGILGVGGVQAENNTPPGPYVKTTTVAINTLSVNCCSEVVGWTPVKTSDGHRVVGQFILHEV